MRDLLNYIQSALYGVPEVSLWDGRTAVEGFLDDMEVTVWPEPTWEHLSATVRRMDAQAVRVNPFDLPTLLGSAGQDSPVAARFAAGLTFVVYPSDETRVSYYVSDGPDWSVGDYNPDDPPADLTTHQRGIVAIPDHALTDRN